MSWESEAQRIASAMGQDYQTVVNQYGSGRGYLENIAPAYHARGLSINPEGDLSSSHVGPATGTPAQTTTQYTAGGSPLAIAGVPAVGLGGVGQALALLGKATGSLPAWLTGAAAVGGTAIAAYGGLQAITGGDLFGSTGAMTVGGVPLGGPGVAEPPAAMVEKAWKVMVHKNTGPLGVLTGESNWWIYFWKLRDGRVMMWDAGNNRAKIWRPKKHIVISSNPRLSQLKKLDRTYNKVQKMVRRYAPHKMTAAAPGRTLVCKTK